MKTITLKIPTLADLKAAAQPQARTLTKTELKNKALKAKGTLATKLRSMAAALED